MQHADAQGEKRAGYFRPRRLGHVNLYISDYERSLWFYRDVVGLPDGWTRPAIGGGFLNNGATHHDIGFIPWNSPVTRKRADGPGLNHLAFEIESEAELVGSYEAARAGGFAFHATVDHLISHSLYCWDPHKFGIEIYADTDLSFADPGFGELRRASTDWTPVITPDSHVKRFVADHRPRVEPAALFHSRKLTGAVVVSEAYEAAYDFYTRVVGLALVAGGREAPFATLTGTCGDRDLTLVRPGEGRAPGFHHMNFAVFGEDDFAASLARAAAFGVTVEKEIDHPRRRGAVVSDPDGIRVLFYVDRGDPLDGIAALDGDAIWLA